VGVGSGDFFVFLPALLLLQDSISKSKSKMESKRMFFNFIVFKINKKATD
jgi:hypothetical protein